jgi:hypothetical protein
MLKRRLTICTDVCLRVMLSLSRSLPRCAQRSNCEQPSQIAVAAAALCVELARARRLRMYNAQ